MIKKIEQLLNIQIKNLALIKNALQHSTYVNENPRLKLSSNERLEFLGDAVLELTVSDFLYRTYPDLPEGQLTMMRAQLVQEGSLAYLSKQLGLNEAIYLGKGELVTGGRNRESILADAYEAMLGAIYLDQGIEIARKFVNLTMLIQHEEMIQSISQDFKTKLQELVQQRGSIPIRYEIIEETGPAHNRTFVAAVLVEEQTIAIGKGKNKKQAETEAAKKALTKIDQNGYIK